MDTKEDQDTNLRGDQIDAHYNRQLSGQAALKQREHETGLSASEGSAFASIAKNYSKTADSSAEEANIARLRHNEEANRFGYNKSTSGSQKGTRAARLKSGLKKYGASGGIIGALFGGLFGFGLLFSPSLAIINLKEVLTGDLNDQAGAMQIRSNKVLFAKLNNMGKSYSSCTLVKFRCGLKGMTDRQIANFEKAGIKVNTVDGGTKNPITRKTGINSITVPTSDGPKELKNINDVRKVLFTDSTARAAARRGYNPLFYGLWDKTAGKAFQNLRLTKADKLNGTTEKELDKSFNDSTDQSKANLDAEKRPVDPNETDQQAQDRQALDENASKLASGITESKGFGSTLSTGFKGLGALGWVDNACTVLNASLAVESGAKVIRAARLASYAMIFLTIADKMKASGAGLSPEEVSYVGTKLTETDTRKTIVDETSTVNGDNVTQVANPDYGKNAYDSAGYHTAAYNDAPTLSARSQQFMVGGAMVGTLAGVNNFVLKALAGPNGTRADAKGRCKIVQNGFVRGAGLVVGGFAAIFTGGLSAVAGVAASAGFAFALPILEGYLKDMIAGDAISAATSGVDAGNAIFSGTSVILGNTAMSRGMQPATKDTLSAYQAAIAPTMNQYIADETEAARKTPFDVANQYSFLGSLGRKLLPTTMAVSSSTASLSTILSSTGSLVTSALFPSAKAATSFNADRYSKCNDGAYKDMGIDADVFCNVRYALTPTELSMDTDETYQWMYDNGYVNEDGNPKSTDNNYSKWLTECTERQYGWGDSAEEDNDTGADCMDKNAATGTFTLTELQHFRVFTFDRGIEQGMDDGPQTGASSAASATVTQTGDVVFPTDPKIFSSDRSAFLQTHNGAGTFTSNADQVALDLALPKGTQIYAMVGGKVVKKPLGRSTYVPCSGNRLPNNGGLMIESQIQGGTLDIAYAHGDNVTDKTDVSAGEPIMLLSDVGNACGAHAHIDMAFNGKAICPQDVMVAIGNNTTPDFASLTAKANPGCGGRT